NEQTEILRQRLNRWDSNHQKIFRQFVSDAEVVTLDGAGRFLIPKRYLKMSGITQVIKFIGMDDTIEIWSSENTEKPFMEPQEFSSALESIMGHIPEVNIMRTDTENV
ncbi:MAG: cell division/cell wall cluster transcriptional repressor MraZ, partial [Prevotella sp.]|nr:cell division/cell wall cluster transcriptional repressor MraZ [Prevotella sp.]